MFKKEDDLSKENYRPVRVLSLASKIFERRVLKQMNLFFPNLTGKLFTTAHKSLLDMSEKWKHALDKGKKIGTIFMDLYKAFDSLNHNLLLLNKI